MKSEIVRVISKTVICVQVILPGAKIDFVFACDCTKVKPTGLVSDGRILSILAFDGHPYTRYIHTRRLSH